MKKLFIKAKILIYEDKNFSTYYQKILQKYKIRVNKYLLQQSKQSQKGKQDYHTELLHLNKLISYKYKMSIHKIRQETNKQKIFSKNSYQYQNNIDALGQKINKEGMTNNYLQLSNLIQLRKSKKLTDIKQKDAQLYEFLITLILDKEKKQKDKNNVIQNLFTMFSGKKQPLQFILNSQQKKDLLERLNNFLIYFQNMSRMTNNHSKQLESFNGCIMINKLQDRIKELQEQKYITLKNRDQYVLQNKNLYQQVFKLKSKIKIIGRGLQNIFGKYLTAQSFYFHFHYYQKLTNPYSQELRIVSKQEIEKKLATIKSIFTKQNLIFTQQNMIINLQLEQLKFKDTIQKNSKLINQLVETHTKQINNLKLNLNTVYQQNFDLKSKLQSFENKNKKNQGKINPISQYISVDFHTQTQKYITAEQQQIINLKNLLKQKNQQQLQLNKNLTNLGLKNQFLQKNNQNLEQQIQTLQKQIKLNLEKYHTDFSHMQQIISQKQKALKENEKTIKIQIQSNQSLKTFFQLKNQQLTQKQFETKQNKQKVQQLKNQINLLQKQLSVVRSQFDKIKKQNKVQNSYSLIQIIKLIINYKININEINVKDEKKLEKLKEQIKKISGAKLQQLQINNAHEEQIQKFNQQLSKHRRKQQQKLQEASKKYTQVKELKQQIQQKIKKIL